MKTRIKALLSLALKQTLADENLTLDTLPEIKIDNTRSKEHGDFACNLAMLLAKPLKKNPRAIAEQIIGHIPDSEIITKIEIAGPGFINFYVSQSSQANIIATILEQGDDFGKSQKEHKKSVCIEFVSANPTGPLHVGHGRGAAYGASLANLLSTTGNEVHCEYYINDAGRQMDILATSVWLRYLDLASENDKPVFPSNGYKGDYIWDIAADLHRDQSNVLVLANDALYDGIHPDENNDNDDGDKEKHIDDLIAKAKVHLGEKYATVFNLALHTITDNIKTDLDAFGVHFDEWFSEKSLMDDGSVDNAITALETNGTIYTEGKTKWFRSTDYGDEKDRVVVRDNGLKTYFASDLAYHKNKAERKFDHLINIWGADHHGYIARVNAGMGALGIDPKILTVLLVQFANLFRDGSPVPMSTRSGSFVTLRELAQEVGVDAARFFYVMRKAEQHMDFDLDLAKAQNADNPVYYIQYAHARVHSVMRQLASEGKTWDKKSGLESLDLLALDSEQTLINKLNQYPEMLEKASHNFAPHQLANYLRELAHDFHSLYNTSKFIVDDDNIRNARLCLVQATAQTIHNGLKILGVSAPTKM